MAALERFLTRWYGPRRPEYGDTEQRLAALPLPATLRRFYAFAGRWPAANPEAIPESEEFFYTGQAGHHLRPLDTLQVRPDRSLDFFMEYQGDWTGLTRTDEADPPVWIEGYWEDDERDANDESGDRTRQVASHLSEFLVSHCLMATLYDGGCLYTTRTTRLLQALRPDVRIWEMDGTCPQYRGEFFLIPNNVLAHRDGHSVQFGALAPDAVTWLQKLERNSS